MINAMDAMANTSVAARKVTLQLSRVKVERWRLPSSMEATASRAGVENNVRFLLHYQAKRARAWTVDRADDYRSACWQYPRRKQSIEQAIFRVTLPEAQEDSSSTQATAETSQAARYDGPGPDRSLD